MTDYLWGSGRKKETKYETFNRGYEQGLQEAAEAIAKMLERAPRDHRELVLAVAIREGEWRQYMQGGAR